MHITMGIPRLGCVVPFRVRCSHTHTHTYRGVLRAPVAAARTLTSSKTCCASRQGKRRITRVRARCKGQGWGEATLVTNFVWVRAMQGTRMG